MDRRLAIVAVAVLAVAGVVTWFTWGKSAGTSSDSGSDATRPSSAAGAPVMLAPSPFAPATPPRPSDAVKPSEAKPDAAAATVLRGSVRGRDGETIAGVTVYTIAKDAAARGDYDARRQAPNATSDATGRWTLSARTLAGLFIGAVHAGYRPAFADGDAVTGAKDVDLILERGPVVSVRALDEVGKPVKGVESRIQTFGDSASGAAPMAYPAPDEPFDDVVDAVTGEDGVAELRTGTTSPVWVVARADDFISDPEQVDLERAEGRVEFTMRPSCVINVTMVSAQSGEEVRDGLSLELVTEPGEEYVDRRSVQNWTGNFEMKGPDYRPGTYRLLVTGAGYRPWRSAPIALKAPGDAVDVIVRLERDLDVGDLVLALTPALGETGTIEIDGMWVVTMRRRDRADAEWSHPPGDRRWDAASSELTLDRLPPVPYDVLVWDTEKSRCCGVASNVPVRKGERSRYTVSLVRGVEIAVADVYAEGEPRPTILPRAGDLELPCVVFFGPGTATISTGPSSWSRKFVLGPYPFASVEVALVAPDGKKQTMTFPRK